MTEEGLASPIGVRVDVSPATRPGRTDAAGTTGDAGAA